MTKPALKTKLATVDQHAEAFDLISNAIKPLSVADMRYVVSSVIGHIDEYGVKIVGNETTFISAAPDEDGAHVTLTIRL